MTPDPTSHAPPAARAAAPPIPAPRLQTLHNRTPLLAFQCDKMGVGRRFFDTVVVKGTFLLAPGRLEVAPEQDPIALADEPWEDAPAERSSLRVAGEVLLVKPSTDVLVTGSVHAPGGRPVPQWDVAIDVRRAGTTVLDHRAQVTGPRAYQHHGERGWTVTEPEPTSSVPIRYELAYGGAFPDPASSAYGSRQDWIVHRANPSGTGFADDRSLTVDRAIRAPQWQLPGHPPTAPNKEVPLAGFGPVARPWSSRLRYAGTYDAAWKERTLEEIRAGLPADYPADFDPRFFQCAHPSLITPEYLHGDEEITLTGMTPAEGPLVLRLPGVRVFARLLCGTDATEHARLPLDTVHVDLDRSVVHLCWRLTLDQARDVRAALLFAAREP